MRFVVHLDSLYQGEVFHCQRMLNRQNIYCGLCLLHSIYIGKRVPACWCTRATSLGTHFKGCFVLFLSFCLSLWQCCTDLSHYMQLLVYLYSKVQFKKQWVLWTVRYWESRLEIWVFPACMPKCPLAGHKSLNLPLTGWCIGRIERKWKVVI